MILEDNIMGLENNQLVTWKHITLQWLNMENIRSSRTTVDYDIIEDAIDDLTKEGTGDIYLNEKWISFRKSACRRKMETKDNQYSKSQCASTAVRNFKKSGKIYGIFLIHHRVDKNLLRNPNKKEYKPYHHANVLVYDAIKREAHYYNPYVRQMKTLPRLVSALICELQGITVIKCITGPQKLGTTTCIKHSFKFVEEYIKNQDIINSYKYYEMSTRSRRCPGKKTTKKIK